MEWPTPSPQLPGLTPPTGAPEVPDAIILPPTAADGPPPHTAVATPTTGTPLPPLPTAGTPAPPALVTASSTGTAKPYTPYKPVTPYVPYVYKPSPVGWLPVPIGGDLALVQGGPFECLPEGALGVCLEPHARNADQAAIHLDVPDFGVPRLEAARCAVGEFLAELGANPGGEFYVGCRAGQGRTGMFLALLAKEAGVRDPIGYVRKVYSDRAIETKPQEAFVNAFTLEDTVELSPEEAVPLVWSRMKNKARSAFFTWLGRRLS